MNSSRKFKKITQEQIASMAKIAETISESQLVYAISEKTTLYLGKEAFISEIGKGNRKGLSIVRLGHGGGVIISSPGDVEIGLFGYRDINRQAKILLDQIGQKITSTGAIFSKDGNDYLIDGKKCIGYSTRNIGDLTAIVIHISINTNLELIKSICTKPMKKIPGALSEYGITTEDIVQILEDFSSEEDSLN